MNDLTMDAPAACGYDLDVDLKLIAVDDAWSAFAIGNGTPELLPPAPLGRSVLGAISDPTTAQVYRDLYQRVRSTGRPVTFPIRCDSPRLRRYLDISITPRPAGFRMRSTVRRTEPNPGGAVLQGGSPHTGPMLRVCSWCKKVDMDGVWEELEVAVPRLHLLEAGPLPTLTHGICEECLERMEAVVECA